MTTNISAYEDRDVPVFVEVVEEEEVDGEELADVAWVEIWVV